MEPLASSWGVHAEGICDWQVTVEENHEAISLFLMGETMRQLSNKGASLVEVQLPMQATDKLTVCQRLGFSEVDQGLELMKTL